MDHEQPAGSVPILTAWPLLAAGVSAQLMIVPCVVPRARPRESAISLTPRRPEPPASGRRIAAARCIDCTGPGIQRTITFSAHDVYAGV
jgi:hypothetical protein